MIRVTVQRESRQTLAEFVTARQRDIVTAQVRALNRAVDTAQTVASRQIRKVYNIKARAVSKAIKKIRAHKLQAYLRAELRISGALIPLIEFDARWTRKTRIGASFRIKKGGGRKRIKGAFIGVHGYTGVKQVFVRTGKSRYPIKSLRSLSLPQAFVSRAVIDAVREATRLSFSTNFRQQLTFLGNR